MFLKTFGCCRKVWNLMLADKEKAYKDTGKSITVTPAKYKGEYPFLKEVDSLALANEQLSLQKAFRAFFEKRAGYPRFKSKKHDRSSYTTNLVNGNITLTEKSIRLPKIGEIRAKIHRNAPDGYALKSVTVSMEPDGGYYASVLYAYDLDAEAAVVTENSSHIGIDYKSDGLFVASDGSCPEMPHYYKASLKKLVREQKKLSRKQKGSANRNKQRQKVASVHHHIANQRKDFLHKLSAEMTNQYELISAEDLDLKQMTAKKPKADSRKKETAANRAALDNGYALFLSMLSYKQERKGHRFIKVDRYYPSSQLCQCGYQNPVTKDLSVRQITCPVCGKTYDRDLNAAINIDKEGLRLATA